jgi:hypothetical protein
VLHHYAGLHKEEIAEILGIPSGTVGSRIHHATRRLRAALDGRGYPPQGSRGVMDGQLFDRRPSSWLKVPDEGCGVIFRDSPRSRSAPRQDVPRPLECTP